MPAPTLPDPVGVLFGAMLATMVVTPMLSLLVLWRYRRAVDRSMRATARGGGQPAIQPQRSEALGHAGPAPAGSSVPVVVATARDPAAASAGDGAGWRQARRRMRSIFYVYVAAGVAYGLVATIVWLKAGGLELLPRRLSTLVVLNAWPVVPTVLAVLAADRRIRALVWVGYVLLVLLLSAGTGVGLGEVLALVALIVLPPGILLLALSGRNLRAVGPFLAVPVLIAAAGWFVWPWLAWPIVEAGATVTQARLAVAVAVAVVALGGVAYLWWSARQYARKRASDQVLLVSQWWFLATALLSLDLVHSGVGWALAAWLAYVAFRVVLAVGLRLRRPAGGVPLRMLLLRVFGAQRRSELLLRRLGASWRHLGAVQMIAGTDLAAATLEPGEFLNWLRGRLDRQFVADADDLRRRVAELDFDPDPDGRYRVNELFCHDDTWRLALDELVHRSDCILLDLRGFTRARQGVTYEITQLVELVPLRWVLVLTDDTSDHDLLRTILDAAWRGLGPASPNRAGGGGALRVLQVAPKGGVDTEAVVSLLATAARSGDGAAA